MALVPQIADAVSVPVIAAGGIMDGRGIAAALMLGASGVQMGTAFVGCPETAANPAYVRRLLMAQAGEAVLTDAFSGRPLRVLRTGWSTCLKASATIDWTFRNNSRSPVTFAKPHWRKTTTSISRYGLAKAPPSLAL